jgi:hypothetical protein
MAAALVARVFEDYYNMRAIERQSIIHESGFEP